MATSLGSGVHLQRMTRRRQPQADHRAAEVGLVLLEEPQVKMKHSQKGRVIWQKTQLVVHVHPPRLVKVFLYWQC
ncbi:MAG: hypothetical protein QF530_09225 [SAR202 cluster bacterium]|nr:hypothetical protein [SAR202 cluster bacterium]